MAKLYQILGLSIVAASIGALPGSAPAGSTLEVVQTVSAPCANDGSGFAIAVSPDGQFVYEGSYDWKTLYDGEVRVSTRNPVTGALTLVQRVAVTGAAPGFTPSPGWEHLYVSSSVLGVYARDAGTGMLTFVESHPAGSAAVSPDGAHVYVAAGSTLTAYLRNASSGALTQIAPYVLAAASAGDVVVSPDGAHVYVSANGYGSGSTYARDGGTGVLTFLGLHSAGGDLLVTPDGANIYATDSGTPGGSVRVFSRNAGSGALTLIDTESYSDPGLPATWFPERVALSSDGAQLYVAGVPVVVFSRSLVDGSLTFLEEHDDQVGGVDGLADVHAAAVTADGSHVYTIGEGTVTFARTSPSGALTFLANRETEGRGTAVAVSPDGAHAYRLCGRAIEICDRDAGSGQLTPVAAFALDTLDFAEGIYLSPDGEHLYVRQAGSLFSGADDRLLVLDRDPGTGALGTVAEYSGTTFGDGFLELTFSPDGAYLYVGGLASLLVLARNPATGLLTLVDTEQPGVGGVPTMALTYPTDVVVSPDGEHVYVGSYGGGTDDGIAIFDRDPGTGAVTFNAMKTVNGGGGGSLDGIAELAVSPDGLTVHAAGGALFGGVGAIATYMRTPGTGALTFVSSLQEGTDAAGTLDSPVALDAGPDGTYVYAWSQSGINVLRRDLATGALAFVHTVTGIQQYYGADDDGVIALAPGGKHVYAVEIDGDVAVLAKRAVCSVAPASGCAAADAASLKIVEKVGPSDLVAWKWKAPGAIAVGDPLATTEFALCLYDVSASSQPVLSSLVEPGGTCGTRPCWAPNSVGFKYVDKVGAPDGVTKIRLLTGGSGTAKIVLKGKGASLPPLELPYAPPVTLQLQASNGECWEADYAAPTFNDAVQFKATQ